MNEMNELNLLKTIAEMHNNEVDIHRMFYKTIKLLVDHSTFETAWIFLINDSGHHEMITEYKLPQSLKCLSCDYMNEGSCWCVRKFHSGELLKASNIIVCSRIELANHEQQNASDGITHHATVPLVAKDHKYGVLNVAIRHRTEYTQDELSLLESIAYQIGSTIQRIRLTEQQIEHTRQQERNRLARDLHDSVKQMLFSIHMMSHAMKNSTDMIKMQDAFKNIEASSETAQDEMKSLLTQLRPSVLENGLIEAWRSYGQLLNITIRVHVDGIIHLDESVEMEMLKIGQEVINNVYKHAYVDVMDIFIEQQSNQLNVKFIDSGVGFDTTHVLNHHYGLTNMKERIHKLNGKINIVSQQDVGTSIDIEVPI